LGRRRSSLLEVSAFQHDNSHYFWINRCPLNLELSVLVHRLRSASRLHLLLGLSDRRRKGIEMTTD